MLKPIDCLMFVPAAELTHLPRQDYISQLHLISVERYFLLFERFI